MTSNSKNNDFSNFFVVADPFSRKAIRLDPTDEWCNNSIAQDVTFGKHSPRIPVTFEVSMGTKPTDFLWCSYFYICISLNLERILKDNKLRGLKTYEVNIRDRLGKDVENYLGFSVLGPKIIWQKEQTPVI